ncbi:MAG: hypothetical protein IJT59_07685 [Desulfovibrionaceae bacterium]|nr:hypothetical protein [Desulfovibrionaceae bacterium]
MDRRPIHLCLLTIDAGSTIKKCQQLGQTGTTLKLKIFLSLIVFRASATKVLGATTSISLP